MARLPMQRASQIGGAALALGLLRHLCADAEAHWAIADGGVTSTLAFGCVIGAWSGGNALAMLVRRRRRTTAHLPSVWTGPSQLTTTTADYRLRVNAADD
jgi:hypothetical protein